MKKVLAWVLLLATVLSLFAGCKKTETPETTAAPSSGVTAQQAIEYLKAVYPTSREVIKTAVDYERMAVVRINDIPLEVVWTVDVAEDLVKIVPGDNGTVTVDVKEQSETEVNYTLTATVTDDAGGTASYSWKYMLPAYVFVDMAAVVEEAYKLKEGQSMDYAVTLTGKITRVKEVYNPDFKNITVVIEVEGAEDKPITCYRMKGEGADKLKVGDIITVTGVITNYKGTIEFEAGCTLDAYIEGEGVEAPEDVGQILKEAYALKQDKSLPYEVTLTGKITKINTPYDKSYKNVSVTMVVDGYEKYPILCYRIKGNGADNLFIGDTITVRGYICNYKGTIEFEAGSILEKVEKTGKEYKAPSDVKQILKEAYALKENDSLPYECTLTGVITKVNTAYDANYQNVTVTIVVDGINEYPIKCYRMKGSGANKIGKGDTITVTGWITNYKGTIEFAAGCSLDKWKDTGSDTPDVDIFIPTMVPELVEKPVPGTAYKFYVDQKILKKTLYFTGKMDGYYFETTEDPEKAADVFVEQVSGGYRVYTMNSGRKNYLEIVKKGDYTNVVLTTSPSKTLKWNDTIKSVTCDVNGEAHYFGTYKEYETFSASNISYVTGDKAAAFDVTNFVGHFATLKESEDAKKTPAELVYNALLAEYFETGKIYSTPENYTLQNVFDVKGNKVNVTWTVDNKAVSVVDNKNGTVTVKVTRAKEDTFYNLTMTIKSGDKTYTATAKYKVPAKAATKPEDIVNLAYKLKSGESLPDKYTLTGVIIGTDTPYSAEYKNISVVIVVGNMSDKPILCYRLKGEGADQLGKGDTVTVTGILKNYNGIIEFDTGCTLDSWKNTGKDAPAKEPDIEMKPIEDPDDDVNVDDFITNLVPEVVPNPAVNTAYKFMVEQKNLNKKLYLTGEMDGYYFATTTNPQEAADVYLEKVSGGYRVYLLKNGAKSYIEIVKSGTHNNVVFTAAPTKVLKWNEDIKSVTCDVEGEEYYFGTYNTFKTFSASQLSRITGENADAMDKTNFVAHFVTMKESDLADKSPAEQVMAALKEAYGTDVISKAEDFELKSEYIVKGTKVTVVWTSDNKAATIVDNKDGTVTVKVTRGKTDVNLKITATIVDGNKKLTESWNYKIPAQAATTPEAIVNAAYDLAVGEFLPDTYTLSGVITEVQTPYDANYKNVSVVIVVGNMTDKPILCYRMKGTGADQIGVGDTITVTGKLKNYNGTIEFDAGCTLDSWKDTGDEAPETKPTTPPTDPTEPADTNYVTAPETGKAYKFMLTQRNLGKNLYITGEMDGYYYQTTENAAEAADVYLEAVSGGYRAYILKNGVKNYLEIVKSGTYNNVVFTTNPSKVLKWNTEISSVTCDVEGEDFYFGTYNTFKTFSASQVTRVTGENASAFDTTNFVGHFYEADAELPTEPTEPSTDPTEPSTEPTEPGVVPEIVTSPVAGTAYKFMVNQKIVGKVLYLTGEMDGYYYQTTENAEEAADVYLETVSGGYRVYFLKDGVKNYLEVIQNGTYTNVVFTTSPTKVLKWNDEIKSVTCDVDGTDYYIGSYKTYVTFSASKISYVTGENASTFDETNFVGHFATLVEGENPTEPTEPSTEPTEPSTEPTEPTEPVTPGYVTEPETGKAYKFMLNQLNLGKNLYITGQMDGYYYQTTENAGEAADVYFEEAEGGYYLYIEKNGVKSYLEIVKSGTHNNVVFVSAPTKVLKWNAEIASVTCDVEGEDFYFGTYNTFKTFSASQVTRVTGENASAFDTTNFVGHFYAVGGQTPTEPTEPSTEPTEPSTEPTEPSTEPSVGDEYITAPAVDTAYKMRVNQKLAGKTLYLTGEMDGYYYATTENVAEAADVYFEAAEGGYRLYVLKDGVKNYLEIVQNGNYTNVVFTATPTKVLKWNDEIKSVTCDVDGTDHYFGSYKTYVTFSASKISYVTGENAATFDESNFVAHFYGVSGSETPTEPTDPTEPSTEPTEPSTEPSTPAENGYIKVTAADQLVSGQYVLIVGTGYAPGAVDGTWLSAVQPVVSGNKVTDTKGAVWTLTVSDNGVSLKDANGVFVAPKGGNNNGIKTGSEYVWAVTFADGTFRFAGTGSDTVMLASNATSQYGNKFRGYKNTTIAGDADTYPCDFTLYKLVGEETPAEPTEPTAEPTTAPTEPTTGVQIVTDPVPGTAYKFMLTQKNLGKQLYLSGKMDGYYYGTTEEYGSAADVYLEEVEGGYRFYVMVSGAKNYMEIVKNGNYNNVVFTTTPTKVLKWNAGINSLTCDVDGVDYYFGTYNTYKTFSASTVDRVTGEGAATLDETNFVGHFVTMNTGNTEPTEPGVTDPTTTDVTYKYGSAEGYTDVILNWGKRGAAATFQSPNAKKFYSDNNLTYADLAALAGSSNLSNVASSALYKKLQEVMTNAQEKETSYGDTRYLFCFTDCQNSSSSTISCFYSGTSMNSAWDEGTTYNREHCWPKSKTASGTATNSTKGINGDIMTLRPAKSNLNSSRGNKGYGTSVDFYNPNSVSNGAYDLRGDVARLVLYTYVRWGNTQYMWGVEGVMESKEILLDWIAADPVDTWELGRNDSVESITGTRNIFVDYPELAFILFGETVPAMTTPSGNAAA